MSIGFADITKTAVKWLQLISFRKFNFHQIIWKLGSSLAFRMICCLFHSFLVTSFLYGSFICGKYRKSLTDWNISPKYKLYFCEVNCIMRRELSLVRNTIFGGVLDRNCLESFFFPFCVIFDKKIGNSRHLQYTS